MITSNWLRALKSGVVALVAIVAMAAVPHAVQAATVFTDGFGTGSTDSTFNEAPTWTEGGAGAEKRASGSGNDSASPNGGRFAVVFGNNGSSEGRLCTTIDATGYTNLMLSYFWRGDDDSHNPSDDGLVQYRASGACSDSSGWTTLKNHDMQSDSSWTTQSAFAIAPSNQSFLLRFYTDTNQDDEHFRVDGVLVEGDVADVTSPSVTINQAITQTDPTDTSPIVFTVVFSESVTGFSGADITLGGTAGATTAIVSGSGDTYSVSVSGMTQNGTVTATVNAAAAEDASGNDSLASTSSDNQVVYEVEVPPTPEEQCELDGGTWNEGSCDFPPTPQEECELAGNIWNTETQTCEEESGPTDQEICEEEGGIWDEESSNCNDSGPTDQEICEENGGFWNGDGCEESELDPGKECIENGGLWDGENCEYTPEQQCALDGGEWNQEEEGEVSFCIIEEENNQDSGGGNTNMGVGGGNSGGSVLGAATESCEALLSTYMGEDQENDATEVTELQTFLNDKESAGLTVSGIFDGATTDAVRAFQLKYWEEVLQPWFNIPGSTILDQDDATGIVYKTTQRMVNNLHCPSLELPMPELP